MGRLVRTAVVLLVTLFGLTSCYVPDRFRAELRLSRFGDWSISFDGDLLYGPMLHEYAENRVKPEEEADRLEHVMADLRRDPAIKYVKSAGRGRFNVRYERQGRIGREQLTAFVRRDARILMIKSQRDNQIIVGAHALRPAEAEAMATGNINMTGEFRITTDASVIQNNATEIRQFGAYRVYIWKIENSLSPMPKLVMVRDADPDRPLP
jgi:hypothetical protein